MTKIDQPNQAPAAWTPADNKGNPGQGKFTARLHQSVQAVWAGCHEHPFLTELRSGSLSLDRFAFYMKQDYVFLKDYVKMFALGSLKAWDLETMGKFADLLQQTLNVEMELHRQYAEKFGITRDELESTEPAPVTLAYTKYMLDAGAQGTLGDVVASLLPCMWSYSEIGSEAVRLHPECLKHELYREWFMMYNSDEFRSLADWCVQLMDQLAEGLPERELARLEERFVTTSRFEYMFWDMAYRKAAWDI
ncbi:thiaminase II [Paenibacillus physcomitrellae]|uniref:Aminopyrimidine aminohydrolase n=1 Tax=Paenibacillus physcomitrellae TaxID=1619311 RepID=A0ABQ1GNY7_9BACL|nr:thiaminase II [Paenibacillus physcomitrellae]GGA47560.1 aminopyrimidine aminohydrolase [Paenibacillus physcomitrellae]